MTFKILQTSVVLALCLVANAHPKPQQRRMRYFIGAVDDWVSSGNYDIYSCSSQASEVKNLLDLTYLYVQNALLSFNTPAYKAFFRSADPSPIKTVLGAITTGTNITAGGLGPMRPTLVCVNAIDPGLDLLWSICNLPSNPILVQPPDSSLVFLCPVFFEKALSPQAKDCGTVNHAQTRLITDDPFDGTQYGHLSRMLAEMYIRETFPGVTTGFSAKPRTQNECLELPPDEAVKSASSYGFFLWNVRAGCTDFPSRVPIQRDRELLGTDSVEVGGNRTGIVAVECGSNNANSSDCSL